MIEISIACVVLLVLAASSVVRIARRDERWQSRALGDRLMALRLFTYTQTKGRR